MLEIKTMLAVEKLGCKAISITTINTYDSMGKYAL
jgi:hypothetical protein